MPWRTVVEETLADAAVDEIANHLAQGDSAPDDEAIAYQIDFALASGRTRQLRDKVHDLLRDGTIEVSTLASRLVSSRTIVGIEPDWQLSTDIDQTTFGRLAPSEDDPWYDSTPENVDMRDRSWNNKRRFAAGRFRRPAAVIAGTSSEETTDQHNGADGRTA